MAQGLVVRLLSLSTTVLCVRLLLYSSLHVCFDENINMVRFEN